MNRRSFIKKCASLFFFSFFSKGCTATTKAKEQQPPSSDHFDGEKFFNPDSPIPPRSFWDVVQWRSTRVAPDWKSTPKIKTDVPPERVEGEALRVSFVGHATLLIQTQGLNLLLDPVWSERASPFSFAGPKRVNPPGIALGDLPPIDAILITHNHYDHLDVETVDKVWQKHRCRIIAPLKNAFIIQDENPNIPVEEYDWEDRVSLSPGVHLFLQPAHHNSARGIFDRDRSLWCAFVITTPAGNLYLAGDTGFNEGKHIRRTFEKFGPFRFAAIPVGAYEPRWFMKDKHVNPEEAVKIAGILQAKTSLGIHLQTFKDLTDEEYDQPVRELSEALEKRSLPKSSFRVLKAGNWLEL